MSTFFVPAPLAQDCRSQPPSSVLQEEAAPEGGADAAKAAEGGKTGNSYVGIHATGFKDFLLKPEILRAIVDCGFEHPSEGEARAETLFGYHSRP